MAKRSKRVIARESTSNRNAPPVGRAEAAVIPSSPSIEQLFMGPRPTSFSRGLEPAFLLIERGVMEQLREKAAALGMGDYDSLVKRILREHIADY